MPLLLNNKRFVKIRTGRLTIIVGYLQALGLLLISAATLAAPNPVGWYSGDIHVHRSCGDAPESIGSIFDAMVSQDLNVISLLADMGNGEVKNPVTDLPKVNGHDDSISISNRIVRWDTEWH